MSSADVGALASPRLADRRVALLLVLVASAVALFSAARPWHTVLAPVSPGLPLQVRSSVAGSQVAALVRALALVGLASGAALLATSGRVARLVGVLVTVAGVGLAVAAWRGGWGSPSMSASPGAAGALHPAPAESTSAWPAIAVGCGVVMAAGGALAAWAGGRWSGLGRRYDAPPARTHAEPSAAAGKPAPVPGTGDSSDLWKALDRGEDPTS